MLATMINIVDCLYYMFNYKVSRFLLEKFAINGEKIRNFPARLSREKSKGCR